MDLRAAKREDCRWKPSKVVESLTTKQHDGFPFTLLKMYTNGLVDFA